MKFIRVLKAKKDWTYENVKKTFDSLIKKINKEGLYRYPMYREDAMDNLLTFVNKNTINLNLTNTEKEYTANELLDYLDNEGLIKEISEDDDEL